MKSEELISSEYCSHISDSGMCGADVKYCYVDFIYQVLPLLDTFEEKFKCSCTDPKDDQYGSICVYCAYRTALKAFDQQKERMDALEKKLEAAEKIVWLVSGSEYEKWFDMKEAMDAYKSNSEEGA